MQSCFVQCCQILLHKKLFKPHDYSRWPAPPCKMYYPLDPLYDVDCPEVTAYVCGTNGLTYKNECFLCVDQCLHGFTKYWKTRDRLHV
ncbi:hypothetical protein FD754_000344 [Muntiacus muntjak]|uniref:Kazal-like domain-containing protein n=1 Tax=Muntiacus muntjak TaxID=9888 RepID=A0A5N3W565_MUNMU|nr:hypothetical protein FD754_000344 [Muntiacus muntjak]